MDSTVTESVRVSYGGLLGRIAITSYWTFIFGGYMLCWVFGADPGYCQFAITGLLAAENNSTYHGFSSSSMYNK